MNNFFKVDIDAKRALWAGLGIAILYKLYKLFLLSILGLDPTNNYTLYEGHNTLFRIIGAITAFYFIRKFRVIQQVTDRKTILKFVYISVAFLALYGVKHVYFVFNYFDLKNFIKEIVFNIPVGFFEEAVFRGLIFAAICKFRGFKISTWTSAIIFSLWHYDVYLSRYDFYIMATLAGFMFNYMLYLGCPIIIMCLLHSLWDLIYFGFVYKEIIDYGQLDIAGTCIIIMFTILMLYRFVGKKRSSS